ncbi:tetratricopeptide (TPR) repeat protein [Paenibacillus shirakamiensis]|uniref:Tetratricopeptide (TPR) repeat protein n=1 Tax=Paenibacillus shirakamiensis TaxID=1265935 RepID=A0ABS4JG05_9BACL|nr:tetratricopeptide (TPR) repeat protein [Paenibacillus shirakamiensis]
MATVLIFNFYIIPKFEAQNGDKVQKDQLEAEKDKSTFSIIQSSTTLEQKWQRVEEFIIKNTGSSNRAYPLHIGNMTTSIKEETPVPLTTDEKISLLEDYVEHVPSKEIDYVSAIKKLANLYYSKGQPNQSLETFRKGESRIPGEYAAYKLSIAVNLAQSLFEQGQFVQAREVLQIFPPSGSKTLNREYFVQYVDIQMKLLLQDHQWREASKWVTQNMTEYKQQFQDPVASSNSEDEAFKQLVRMQLTLDKELVHKEATVTQVTGMVKYSDGTPIAGVGVYLREASDLNHSLTSSEMYETVSNERGEYKFYGVLPGNYQLEAGFDYEQMNGYMWARSDDDWIKAGRSQQITKNIVLHPLMEITSPSNHETITGKNVHFSWTSVPGASYYNISLWLGTDGGSIGSSFKMHIKDSELSVPVEQIYNQSTGISSHDKDGKPDSLSILGFSNPNGNMWWTVEAYDAQGHIMTSSNGYRLDTDTVGKLPFFSLKERTLTLADQLVLQGKLDDAMKRYKEDHKQNPFNVHNLQMILQLYDAKVIRASRADRSITEQEAFPYRKQLLELNPSEKNNQFRLLNYYYDRHMWSEFHASYITYQKLLVTYQESTEDKDNSYELSLYGSALLKQGEVARAIAIFKKVMTIDHDHRFIGNYLAAALLNGDSWAQVVRLAEQYPQLMGGDSDPDWMQLMQTMQGESMKNPDYRANLEANIRKLLQSQHPQQEMEKWVQAGAVQGKVQRQFLQDLSTVD